MDKEIAQLTWSLWIECPKCYDDIDLADIDEDGIYSKPIFNNAWEDLNGESVTCPKCHHEFEIEKVEY